MSSASLRALLGGAIDYAGLFPPAGLALQTAVENYCSYRDSTEAWALGRFVLPAARLGELAELLRGARFPLTAVLGSASVAELDAIEQFNRRGAELGARVESVEAKVASEGPVAELFAKLPPTSIRYLEIPLDGDLEPVLDAVATAGAYAKIRTGGVTAAAFPPPEQLVRFLLAAARRKLPFKATAGLHHPLRGSYPLASAPTAPSGVMHGFLNLLLAAALAWGGAGATELRGALLEADGAVIRFEAAALRWREVRLDLAQLSELREKFFHSFGSCSFLEPLAELKAGGWA